MEMPSLNHTERAVTTHERKGSLAFDLHVVKKIEKLYHGKSINKTARGKTMEVDLNKVNKRPTIPTHF